MKKITSTAELKNAILLLEEKQAVHGRLLKEQFHSAREYLKPGNMTRSLFSRFSASTDFKIGIAAAALSLAAFHFAKGALVRSTMHPFRKLLGALVRSGISNIVARHPDTIKSVGHVLLQRLFNRKER